MRSSRRISKRLLSSFKIFGSIHFGKVCPGGHSVIETVRHCYLFSFTISRALQHAFLLGLASKKALNKSFYFKKASVESIRFTPL